ncbi:S1C family serine protease [Nannocystis bainbridge]|uniref:Serine protease n=1 Tax=Nannocystis bainbridge TaxID=2995303 RepID=A0ABT5DP23_9BACT|nr:serine protease [Nannocystis bainbridge]MDC0715409.1 serine protease [Nannocystis bainbridge]
MPAAIRILSLCAALVALGCASRPIGDVNLERGKAGRALQDIAVAQKGAAAVAVISTDVGRGLAFVVDPDGYLITNRHVIEDADHIEDITFPALKPPRSFAAVRIVYIDPSRDLALIKVDVDAPLPSLPLATVGSAPIEDYLQAKDRVLLLARPGEDEATGPGGKPTTGFVARTGDVRELAVYNPAVGPGAFFGLSQAVRRGQSGGPVLDRFGRVVGVVSWTWKHRVGGYAIPISEAAQMLSELPDMDTPAEQSARATERARGFLKALDGGDLEVARRMMSPTYSRKIRQRTMTTIAEQLPGDGRAAVQQFVAALEDIVDSEPEGAEELPFSKVQDVVLRTGTRGFMEALGVEGALSKDQVISFFFEFAQAYVGARFFAESDADTAMNAAMMRLQTVDAARTFAFAEATGRFKRGARLAVERLEIVPGAYAPHAVVTLRNQDPDGKQPATLVMQMRLEWGDWYVAELQTAGG